MIPFGLIRSSVLTGPGWLWHRPKGKRQRASCLGLNHDIYLFIFYKRVIVGGQIEIRIKALILNRAASIQPLRLLFNHQRGHQSYRDHRRWFAALLHVFHRIWSEICHVRAQQICREICLSFPREQGSEIVLCAHQIWICDDHVIWIWISVSDL